MTVETLIPIGRALISVSDKTGLVAFAEALAGHGVEILSTGGSGRALGEAGIAVVEVAEHTGWPEMMDGRVKTLHPVIHGGILARRDLADHRDAMATHGIGAIDLVVVNLYPFEDTVAAGADAATCIENIDIGGPALIRSAAKNHAGVAVVTAPSDYQAVIDEMNANDGALGPELRRRLAASAFARTAAYDSAIGQWFAAREREAAPARVTIAGLLRQTLRYGENPHQQAAFYAGAPARPGVATATQIQGKDLSYNNIGDTDAAFELVAEFSDPAVAIIKHANPCGVAVADSPAGAYRRALACDPTSAFGGIIALNRTIDRLCANEIVKLFAEVVIAPDATAEALAVFAEKKNLRLLITDAMPDPAAAGNTMRTVAGGFLVQDRDAHRLEAKDLGVVTKRAPGAAEIADLLFAFAVCKHVKSNAIVYAKARATVGIGAGQMSRIDSARIAAWKARDAAEAAGESASRTAGSVVASDAFFPFADGLLAAAAAGVTAVIQPGGSIRDDDVIAAADEKDLAMVFTGIRHFRH
ncbi:MAG: bifunctional phosphoribosylaminoimidazolecarboxamide formyltransferase/IMP cyclohydrolase [Alphaproteobacteria bacterium]|jgi:phosphoribosylaminoimidazolecarboxamide formyltransferase/IMP cyclohydrolase|nr:bifunctional phosphoribosylaminoimidazolecarboxamide formyltransferase/IMP cyclohydrolase [Alphaproteobacteria bacterium]MDP6515611.1 bifunctional phosphoribosylaminoimidazolecarboxamide formyltransferase/IMP cyclohydrolase [Alphaproteobacteria bacterium]